MKYSKEIYTKRITFSQSVSDFKQTSRKLKKDKNCN